MKVAFNTLGCKVNQYETNVMIGQFINKGYQIVSFNDKADIYVINTCTVTNMSDRKSRQMLRSAKKKNINGIVVAVGCLAQIGKDELEKIDEIDLILGNEDKKQIVKYIEKYLKDKNDKIFVSDIMKQDKYETEELTTFYEKTRAIVKVQDGCNNYCSYCIIPYARGKIRSKPFEDSINEMQSIANNGYKEIVITGIHVCSYGKDLDNDISLIDLLEKINRIEGLKRIRLGSLEPTIITKEFMERLIKLDKFCPHFHLSLQSGNDKTLKTMNRKYTTEQIKNIVNIIREYYPEANITTDIIVGFPGETDEDFEITYNFLKQINLNKMHVFKYSIRKGTVASRMDNQVSPQIKTSRSDKLLNLSDTNEISHLKKYIGKQVEVLLEEKDNEYMKGFTLNYLHTKIKTDKQSNEIVKGRVVDIKNNMLIVEEL
ncbi:MAG: tRNA (N(6)-L-threonylcarbamoyladenosine(37)-C(2))-methylthiotransferase MtaB [Clostridiales bacterium]|nr:tRNA (N(6)-L-threonylcarbamoyladenosine(37)-C(2))-methylthiotransferase MtaB [Clostridiales bacterium]